MLIDFSEVGNYLCDNIVMDSIPAEQLLTYFETSVCSSPFRQVKLFHVLNLVPWILFI